MRTTPRRLMIACVALGIAMAVAGCAPAPRSVVSLTAKDSGSTQSLAVGERLEITLDANPTTGYQWAIDGALPAVLEQAGQPTYTASSSEVVGAGGTELWTFVGKSPGQANLKLKYWRSFEPTVPPVSTIDVVVDVR